MVLAKCIFMHCGKACCLWTLLFPLPGVSWVLPHTHKDMMLCLHGSFVGKSHKRLDGYFMLILLCLERAYEYDFSGLGGF